MADQAVNAMEFFRNESCGKCVPCRIGSQKLAALGGNLLDGQINADRWTERAAAGGEGAGRGDGAGVDLRPGPVGAGAAEDGDRLLRRVTSRRHCRRPRASATGERESAIADRAAALATGGVPRHDAMMPATTADLRRLHSPATTTRGPVQPRHQRPARPPRRADRGGLRQERHAPDRRPDRDGPAGRAAQGRRRATSCSTSTAAPRRATRRSTTRR